MDYFFLSSISASSLFRCCVHAFPDSAATEGVPGCTQRPAHQLRQLSVPNPRLRRRALQTGPAVYTRALLEDQRYTQLNQVPTELAV